MVILNFKKTFEGDNLPALVKKIMSGQFAPIRGPYSSGFKQLVRDLLQTDPDFVEGMKTFFKKAAEEFDHKPIEVVEGIKDAFKKAVEGVIKFLNLS